jgi:hypothetical protein
MDWLSLHEGDLTVTGCEAPQLSRNEVRLLAEIGKLQAVIDALAGRVGALEQKLIEAGAAVTAQTAMLRRLWEGT